MSTEENRPAYSALRTSHSALKGRRATPTLDSVTTIAADGSRRDVHPADVRGRFSRARRGVAWLLIAVYLLLPWIPVGGAPAVFLDLEQRRFHFLGLTLASQDVWLLFFAVTGLGFALFFITALVGRVWCGWACPQTVFLEHVFRRLERWIDGDASTRRALAAAPLGPAKVIRRVVKHLAFALVALAVTHLFLAYFVSIPQLWSYMHEAPGEHWSAFLFVFVTAAVLYFNFAWFREQLCIVICPYGRLQSALTDDHSLQIGYDANRGEPRGKVGTVNAGACIDCNRCVQVCPTGIDIRHGLQLECIGCAACVDACDEVMLRLDRAPGLVRYDSLVGLAGGRTRWKRPRTLLYGALLVVGAIVAAFAFSTVKPANVAVSRMTGAAYFVDARDVRNQFLVRVVNKTTHPVAFTLQTERLPAGAVQRGWETPAIVDALGEQVVPLVVVVDRARYAGGFSFDVQVRSGTGRFAAQRTAEFLGPDPRLLREEEAKP